MTQSMLAMRPRLSSFTVEESNQRLGVPERVVYWVVIVLRPLQTLPLLSASKVAHHPCVEVGDASPGMPERVLPEVAPEVDVDPLKVVGRVVRDEHDGLPEVEPFQELLERVLRAVDATERFHPLIPKFVDIDGAELRHVTNRGRADAEGRFAVNNDRIAHRGITDRLWSKDGINKSEIGSTSANQRSAKRQCSVIERVVKARETGVAHSGFAGNFGECSQMHTVIGAQAIPFRKLARLVTQG